MTYSPNGQGRYDQTKEINFQIKIGNNVIPDYPIVSQSEFYSQLKKALGIHTSSWHALDIYPSGISSYNTNRFIIGIDTERCVGASFTGIETKSGGLTHIIMKCANPFNGILAKNMHIVLCCEKVIKVRATGVEVYE
jgi:hypothetical protein